MAIDGMPYINLEKFKQFIRDKYVDAKRREDLLSTTSFESIKNFLESYYDKPASEITKRRINKLIQGNDYSDEIHKALLKDDTILIQGYIHDRLPKNLCELLKSGKIAITEIYLQNPNAQVELINDQMSFLIQFGYGLSHLHHHIAKLLVATFHFPDIGEWGTPIEYTEAAKVLNDIIFTFESSKGKGINVPEYKISSAERLFLAGYLALEADAFILLHELGHVQLWIKNSKYSSTNSKETKNPFTDEFLADNFALDILLTPHKQIKKDQIQNRQIFAYTGIELALRTRWLFEKLTSLNNQSHPPAFNRILKMRKFLLKYTNADVIGSFAKTLDLVWGQFYSLIYEERREK